MRLEYQVSDPAVVVVCITNENRWVFLRDGFLSDMKIREVHRLVGDEYVEYKFETVSVVFKRKDLQDFIDGTYAMVSSREEENLLMADLDNFLREG